jgi:hypothetical protein
VKHQTILDDFKSTRGRNSDAFWWKKLNWEPAQVSKQPQPIQF